MRRLRKTCWALLVWVTAVSTLAANCPHMTCVCVQSITVETEAAPQVLRCCCCSNHAPDSDSPETENANVEKKSCCHDEETSPSEETNPQDQPARTRTPGDD